MKDEHTHAKVCIYHTYIVRPALSSSRSSNILKMDERGWCTTEITRRPLAATFFMACMGSDGGGGVVVVVVVVGGGGSVVIAILLFLSIIAPVTLLLVPVVLSTRRL